jgi:hypothetical protein
MNILQKFIINFIIIPIIIIRYIIAYFLLSIHLFPILNRIDWLFKLGLNMGFTIDKNRRGKK